LKTQAPKQDEVCDRDGAKLTQRADDNPETFRTRLDNYLGKTVPVLEHYRDRGSLCVIHAAQPIDEVTRSVALALGLSDAAA
jgi:adenylate kinase